MRYVLLMILMVVPLAVSAETIFLNGVAAVVNMNYITYGDIKARAWPQLKPVLSSVKRAELRTTVSNIYTDTLAQMVEAKLIALAFKDEGGEVSADILEKKVAEFIREKFSNDRLRLIAELENDGSSYEDWKEHLREQLITSAMVSKKINSKIAISPRLFRRNISAARTNTSRRPRIKYSSSR